MATSSQHLSARPFRNEADYGLMRRLVIDVLRRTAPPVYLTAGDLDWSRAVADDETLRQTHLWFDGPNLVAFAWPEEDQVEIIIHPDYPALHETALAWAGEHYRVVDESGAVEFYASAFSRDRHRLAALAAQGFGPTDMGRVVYGQRIDSRGEPPVLPSGYTLRHVAGESESEARAAVQRAAFESEFMTADRHRRVQSMPTYRPELDIVIVAPDGQLAAFALVWLDEVNRLGVFEPLGVAVAHQRRGLGRALMGEGLRRLASFGATYACVATGIAHDPARRLYEATGFAALDYSHLWRSRRTTDSHSVAG